MSTYFISRILVSIPTLIAMSFVIYGILALAPGDPLSQFAANPEVPLEVRENIKRSLGLDQPWYIRYVLWLSGIFRGDWGFSFSARTGVLGLIMQRLPQTLGVVGTAYLVALLIAIPVGVYTAYRPRSAFSYIVQVLSMAGISMPTFVTGTLLILVFSVYLGWLPMIYDTTLKATDPASLWKLIKQSIMPVAVLAFFQAGALTRFMRSSMLDSLPSDYVRTARAKGLLEWAVVVRHAFRNSLIPVVTLIALQLPGVFAGAIITEQIFRVNGIGDLLIKSIQISDTPVIMGIVFMFCVLIVVCGLIADLLYGILDPRIKLS